MEQNNSQQQVIDLTKIFQILWQKRRTFFKVWIVTFVLSCIWILPQPRYYSSTVKLAPEISGDQGMGSLSNLASSFGINVGGAGGQDAIYPLLYPELFESPEFVVGLYGIHVTTKDGKISTDYFTYMKKHQKKNLLTWPFRYVKKRITALLTEEDNTPRATDAKGVNPFMMNRKDFDLMNAIIGHINCSVDNKNNIITVRVKDQDPLISATMADSVKKHLQEFIIHYRTSKAIEDVAHYQHMRDSAEIEFNDVMEQYSRFCDTHRDIVLQSYQSKRDKLENELALKQNALSVMETQLKEAQVRVQEKTPAFTTLKSTIVPVKPSEPKRVLFVICMLFLASIVTAIYLLREDLRKLIVIKRN